MIYPNDIDKEFVPYLDKLNSFDWFESAFSCTGHKMTNTEGYLVFYLDTGYFESFVTHLNQIYEISDLIWATVICRDDKIGLSIYYPHEYFKECVEKIIKTCEEIN